MSAAIRAGYKQTEVGVIPEDWEVSRVGDVCGCIVPGRNKPKLFDGNIPWITTPDLVHGTPVTTSRLGLCISRAEAKSVGSKVVPHGSVLMSCAGELGIVALTHNEIVVNQQLHVFLPTERMVGAFLLNALSYRKDQIAGLGTKTAVPYLNKNGCNSILVPIPKVPEQRAIAAALGDVDALLGGLDRLIAKKRDLKQAAMQQLLTGQTRLPGFGGDWEVKRLGDVADIDPENLGGNTAIDYEFNYISLEDVDCGVLRGWSEQVFYAAPSRARRRLRKGDVLVSTVRPNLQSHLHFKIDAPHWVCSTGFAVVRCRTGITNPAYVFPHLFGANVSRQIDTLLTGSSYPAINSRDVRALEIPTPSYEEQTAIATILSDMDAELAALEARRDKARALKQGMMQELLTGRIRLV